MIYQSGYLTIKGYDDDVKLYTLGFPNDEIRYGFLNFLVIFILKLLMMRLVSTSLNSCVN